MSNIGKYLRGIGAAAVALASIEVALGQTYYGSQLMSPAERAEHRATMMNLSPSERQAYRAGHHEEMQKRAEAMGLTLPDQPPAYGRGVGRGGPGYGSGYGPGPGYGYRCARPAYGYGYGCGGPRNWGPYGGDWGYPAW
jgi:hypothetical protein